ncbi:acyl-CoA carboxylase subunit epsilon [Dactylosporangium roseum]|uniref:acyl-CoA carboxylase subunit epsilon n=1 Tax=Dactylosporangium roseum TaxID=47989 RepID=UPI0031DF81E6
MQRRGDRRGRLAFPGTRRHSGQQYDEQRRDEQRRCSANPDVCQCAPQFAIDSRSTRVCAAQVCVCSQDGNVSWICSGGRVSEESLFRVVRGTPTAEEVAAIVGALFSLAPTAPPARPARSRWRESALPGARPHWR